MKLACAHRLARSTGFTLVESIIVLVVLSIAAVGIISLQGNIFYGQSDNKDLQVGVQLMQECAEQILATRRRAGYTSVSASACSTLVKYSNFGFNAPSIALTAFFPDNTSTSVTSCPSGSSTCTAVISISLAAGGGSLTPVTVQLTKY